MNHLVALEVVPLAMGASVSATLALLMVYVHDVVFGGCVPVAYLCWGVIAVYLCWGMIGCVDVVLVYVLVSVLVCVLVSRGVTCSVYLLWVSFPLNFVHL